MKNFTSLLGTIFMFCMSISIAYAQPITEPTEDIFCSGPVLYGDITAVNHIEVCNTLGSVEVYFENATSVEWSDFTNQTMVDPSLIDANGNVTGLEAGVYTVRAFDDDGNSCIAQVEILDECCPGDFNGNGVVSASDLSLFLAAFGTDCTGCLEDLNGDGSVTAADLTIFLSLFGTNCNDDGPENVQTDKPTSTSINYRVETNGYILTAPAANNNSVWVAIAESGQIQSGQGNSFDLNGLNNSNTEIFLAQESTISSINLLTSDQLQVFPNPASTYIDISLKDIQLQGNYTLQLLNANGAIVQTSSIQLTDANQRIALNQLSKGFYLLVLQNEKNKITKRVVIL